MGGWGQIGVTANEYDISFWSWWWKCRVDCDNGGIALSIKTTELYFELHGDISQVAIKNY